MVVLLELDEVIFHHLDSLCKSTTALGSEDAQGGVMREATKTIVDIPDAHPDLATAEKLIATCLQRFLVCADRNVEDVYYIGVVHVTRFVEKSLCRSCADICESKLFELATRIRKSCEGKTRLFTNTVAQSDLYQSRNNHTSAKRVDCETHSKQDD